MIRIDEILSPARIFMDLKGAHKNEILRDMCERLAALKVVSDSAEVHRLLMEREGLMTTGVKRGFAFPHAFSVKFNESFLTLGVCKQGVNFESLDGQPVEFIFLLLGPPHHQTVHLRILARVSRLMGQTEMLETLRGADTPEKVMEIMVDTERRLTAYHYNASGA